jgi:hypothetical protein
MFQNRTGNHERTARGDKWRWKSQLTETHDRRNYSRPRSRAIAPVNRLTGFVPPTLFDRARTGARRGKNWTVSPGGEVGYGGSSRVTNESKDITTGVRGIDCVCPADDLGEGGGRFGNGFDVG